MRRSSIEWTETTWNPVTGCTKISAGCKNCYAERMAHRLQATMNPETLDHPFKWRKPRLVFVNSMSDLFHKDVDLSFIQDVFTTMNRCPQHTFQVLTKRPARVLDCQDQLMWTPNIWLGTSVESQKVLGRVDILRQTQAHTKFLSLEPLLGPMQDISLQDINWVIVGGESGPRARPMEMRWVREIRDNCIATSTPFFFKQWGGPLKKRTGRILDGRTWDELPVRTQPQPLP